LQSPQRNACPYVVLGTKWRPTMTANKWIIVLALVLAGTSTGFAQSQRNYGPAGPATGDSFGEPYSGSAQARVGDRYWQRHWHSGSGYHNHYW
jgi:hypothetical protein